MSSQSKASSTTICQKCLQKGHYSYECKTSLQSRPYVSRASRSQQLRNPKLKPALTEAKLNEEEVTRWVQVLSLVSTYADSENSSTTSSRDTEQGPLSKDLEEESHRGRARSPSSDRPNKRRRSDSTSSTDSVSTISTISSSSGHQGDRSKDFKPQRRAESRVSLSRSRTPPRTRPRSNSSSVASSGIARKPGNRGGDREPSDGPSKGHEPRFERERNGPGSNRAPRLRHSRSPERTTHRTSRADGPKPRSLSPYSRRLALTQAMNVDR